MRIHLDPIWEEGINRCRKGLEINHGVILDVNVKVIFEHLTHQFSPLVVILLPNGKGSIELLVIVAIIFRNILLADTIDMDQCIPHKADHLDLAFFVIDIDIQYYAMVDFKTFATAIDTLFPNGVEMNAQFSTVDGEKVSEVEVPDDLNMKDGVVPQQTIKVGKQRMDGRTLLNYSRFRKDDEGDFGRTRRQQEVMSAIMHQIKDPTKLFTGSEALGKVFAMTSTNVPFSFLLTNGLGLVGSAGKGIERVTIPENGDWVDAYDMYGGQGLLVDFDAYKKKLYQMGLR